MPGASSPPPQPGRKRAMLAAAPRPPLRLLASRLVMLMDPNPIAGPWRSGDESEPRCKHADADREPDERPEARCLGDDQDPRHLVAPEAAQRLDVVLKSLAILHAWLAAPRLDEPDDDRGPHQRIEPGDRRGDDRREHRV